MIKEAESLFYHFNPRSPHGERPSADRHAARTVDFNPRSPHGERRLKAWQRAKNPPFQPTLPARGATRTMQDYQNARKNFNPRSPHGERPLDKIPIQD